MEAERDFRFKKLSTIGAVANFVGVILALTAVTSHHWARLSGLAMGYMGPFMVCQDIPGGIDRCQRGGMGPYKQTWASYSAGTCAVFCTILMAVSTVLGVLVVAMHFAQHQICLKFRHATFVRMGALAGATGCSLLSFILFILEAKLFLRMQSGEVADLSWSFYMEILSFVIASATGIASSYEWKWARKLGGDPTIYTRDQEGTQSEAIENKNFRDAPRNEGGVSSPTGQGKVQRNSNGVAMTAVSGLPYMVVGNGGINQKRNGHLPNGRNSHHRTHNPNRHIRQDIVAFDPNKVPLRSSLRRPKVNSTSSAASVDSSDTLGIDSILSNTLQNPSFVNTSPPSKKKVRIHTQSTAV